MNSFRKWICLVLVAAALAASSCSSTVTPGHVQPNQASFDGGEQNSGILRFTPDGFLVTPHFHDRYAALAATYGRIFKPALLPDEGIMPAPDGVNWLVDAEHMAKFVEMNLRQKAGRAP